MRAGVMKTWRLLVREDSLGLDDVRFECKTLQPISANCPSTATAPPTGTDLGLPSRLPPSPLHEATRTPRSRTHGRHRWKIERTSAWLTGYRRLTIRYERHATLFGAFLSLAAALTCWKKLPT